MYGSPPAIRNPVSPFVTALIAGAVGAGLAAAYAYAVFDAAREVRRKRFKIYEGTDLEGAPIALLSYDDGGNFLEVAEFGSLPGRPDYPPVEQAQTWLERFIR
jgi:hypothetical protein